MNETHLGASQIPKWMPLPIPQPIPDMQTRTRGQQAKKSCGDGIHTAGPLRSLPYAQWVGVKPFASRSCFTDKRPQGSFLPITLEQLARDQGVLLKDKTTPCRAGWPTGHDTTPNATVFDPPKHRHNELPACVIYFLGAEINTASFAMYTFSISVLIQALLIISMSGAADHGRFRKTFLLAFAFIGATATALFIAVVPKVYLLGALLAIISNTCFGASFVLLNSFLPVLVRHHPSIEGSSTPGSGSDDAVQPTAFRPAD